MNPLRSKLEQNLGWIILALLPGGCLLIFFGVIGGALAFGFVRVFLGPTLLAVGYRLVAEWSATSRPDLTSEAVAPIEER